MSRSPGLPEALHLLPKPALRSPDSLRSLLRAFDTTLGLAARTLAVFGGNQTSDHGAGNSVETDVLALLPVPVGYSTVHARALGKDHIQLPIDIHCWDGCVHRLRVYASAYYGNITLL